MVSYLGEHKVINQHYKISLLEEGIPAGLQNRWVQKRDPHSLFFTEVSSKSQLFNVILEQAKVRERYCRIEEIFWIAIFCLKIKLENSDPPTHHSPHCKVNKGWRKLSRPCMSTSHLFLARQVSSRILVISRLTSQPLAAITVLAASI